jgi:hypothetical protein
VEREVWISGVLMMYSVEIWVKAELCYGAASLVRVVCWGQGRNL